MQIDIRMWYQLWNPPMGRLKINHEAMSMRFPEGTFAQLDAVLDGEESRTDLIRSAVEREIARRQRQQAKRLADASDTLSSK